VFNFDNPKKKGKRGQNKEGKKNARPKKKGEGTVVEWGERIRQNTTTRRKGKKEPPS